mgnify:CR=1 FL=1
MSEQTIQDGLYSIPVQLDKYVCRSLGATTIKDLVKNKEVTGLTIKECDKIKANRPDVLILNKDKQIVVFIEMKEPDKLKTERLRRLAKYQELGVARQVKAKIYMLSDGETFIWINPITGACIVDENDKPITRKINPKNLSPEQNKELAEFIDDVCYCINDSNNKLMPKEYIDPTPLAQKVARILQNMSLSSAKNSLYTFVEFFTFKFLSDISVLKGIYSFEGIYSIYTEQSAKDAFIQYLTTVRKKLLELFPYNPEDGTTIINGRIFHTETDDIGNPIIHESSADCFGKLLDCFKEYEDEHGKFLNQKKCSVETMEKSYEGSFTYKKREEIHKKYLNALEEVKNTGGEDINAIQDQLQKNKKRYDDLIILQNEQKDIEKKIEESIDIFIDKRLELSKKRQAVIDNLNLENISINVIPLGHLTRWKANLQKEFGREGTFDNDFQNLVNKSLSNDNNWEQYKAFLKFMLITDSGNIEELLGCSTDARFAKLWIDKYKNDTLSSIVKVLPEDKLQIKIIDENGEIDINEGSPGQKSAAILAFILNSGENPLIIDQPEDDLDNSLIYSLVVKSIRKMKSKRQIIIVTHNPNIPVLGDAEGIIVLERNNQGKVTFRKNKKAGCIEEKLIREGICEIMEGGEDAFRKREQKYQYK